MKTNRELLDEGKAALDWEIIIAETQMIINYKEALETAEKKIYLAAYNSTGGNQAATARLFGVSRGTVIKKLKEWGV